jgi:hypothetical protein
MREVQSNMAITSEFIERLTQGALKDNDIAYSVFKTDKEYYIVPVVDNLHTKLKLKIKGPCVLEWQRVYAEDGKPMAEIVFNEAIPFKVTVNLSEKVLRLK